VGSSFCGIRRKGDGHSIRTIQQDLATFRKGSARVFEDTSVRHIVSIAKLL
jgi:hypothetical protein